MDTCIWSLALRRKDMAALNAHEKRLVDAWASLVTGEQAVLIGLIKQEILSGIRNAAQFGALRQYLANFNEVPAEPEDYVHAARFFNTLASRGIAGTAIDLLICAVAYRLNIRIFTTDADFLNYAKFLPIKLHVVSEGK